MSVSRDFGGMRYPIFSLCIPFKGLHRVPHPPIPCLTSSKDTRAYRLESLKGIPVFEVDFPEVLTAKAVNSRSQSLRIPMRHEAVASPRYPTHFTFLILEVQVRKSQSLTSY